MSDQTPRSNVVSRLQARLAAALSLEIFLVLVAATALAALAVFVLDATVILPEPARLAAPWFLGGVCAVVLLVGIIMLRRLTELRVARRMERRQPALGTALTNAVQLARRTAGNSYEQAFLRDAVAYGRAKADLLPVWPVVRRRVAAVAALALVPLLLWAGGWSCYRDVFDSVRPRFTDPRGDHPPYSRTRLKVTPGDTEALYAGQCTISATAQGQPVERLYLVTENSRQTTRTVMFRAPDQSYFQTLTNLREDTRYYVTDGRARSIRHQIAIQYTPRITLVELRSEFPEYTGLKATQRKVEETSLRVPARTRLTFRVASNRPLQSGTLELTPLLGGAKKEVPLVIESGQEAVVAGGFEVTEPVAYGLSVKDVSGRASADQVKGHVTVLPNRRPRISVLEPAANNLATPDITIPVRVEAEDDYRIAAVSWFRGLNQSIDRPRHMVLTNKAGPGSVEARGKFDLKDLGVQPGDKIEFFFEAQNNFPDGENVATSPVFTVEIISVEQYRQLLRQQQAQQMLFDQYLALEDQLRRIQDRAASLRNRQEELEKKGGGTPEEKAQWQKDAAELQAELQRYQEALNRVLAAPPEFDVERAFQESLRRQQPALDQASQQMQKVLDAAKAGNLSKEQLDELSKQLGEMLGETKKEVGEPARMITAVANLLNRADLFARLAAEQAELARLLQRFKDKPAVTRQEQMELQELADRQKQIRDAVSKLLEELPELEAQLPNEEKYQDLRDTLEQFLLAVKDSGLTTDLESASAKLAAQDGPGGYPPAKAAADKMNDLLAKTQGLPGEGQQCLKFQPSVQQALGNSLAQILSAMNSFGSGEGGNGYGLSGGNFGLYGPDTQLSGAGSGPRSKRFLDPVAQGQQSTTGDTGGAPSNQAAKVAVPLRLQLDARFPLRYRSLVGEYFRAVAEAEKEAAPGGADK